MAAAVTAEETILHILNESIHHERNIIGTGSFGTVYMIKYGDQKLAVKVANTKPTSGYQVVNPGDRYNIVNVPQKSEMLLQRETSILQRLGEKCNPYIVCFKYVISPSNSYRVSGKLPRIERCDGRCSKQNCNPTPIKQHYKGVDSWITTHASKWYCTFGYSLVKYYG